MQNHSPKLSYTLVRWMGPNTSGFKCNTDSVSRESLGNTSYGFCYRDWHGDGIYVKAGPIGVATNVIAKATTIWKAVIFGISQ